QTRDGGYPDCLDHHVSAPGGVDDVEVHGHARLGQSFSRRLQTRGGGNRVGEHHDTTRALAGQQGAGCHQGACQVGGGSVDLGADPIEVTYRPYGSVQAHPIAEYCDPCPIGSRALRQSSLQEVLLRLPRSLSDRVRAVHQKQHRMGLHRAHQIGPGGCHRRQHHHHTTGDDRPPVLAAGNGASTPAGDHPYHRQGNRYQEQGPGTVESHVATPSVRRRHPGRWWAIHHSRVIINTVAATTQGASSRTKKPASWPPPGAAPTAMSRLRPADSEGTNRRTATSPGVTSPSSYT